MIRFFGLAMCLVKLVEGRDMEGFIVGGAFTSIYRYPHSAFMNSVCTKDNGRQEISICGASIVNQRILLTAAHCLAQCTHKLTLKIIVGDENIDQGLINVGASYIIHEAYKELSCYADIGIVRVSRKLKLNSKISRVALMKNPPYDEVASVAGWGLVDEGNEKTLPYLKQINQTLMNRKECIKKIKKVPEGSICYVARKLTDYASSGDSGSALVVRGFIQIGIVSFKMPPFSKNIVVYTDIGHYYNWIRKNIKRVYCD